MKPFSSNSKNSISAANIVFGLQHKFYSAYISLCRYARFLKSCFASKPIFSLRKQFLSLELGIFYIFGLLFFTGLVWAAEPVLTPQQIYENMQAQESKINDLQFNLKQVIELKAIKERQVIKGAIIYKKPDLLHVEYTSPTQQLIIANQDDFVLYILEQGKWQENMRQKVSNLIGKQWKSEYGLWSVSDLAKNYEAKATKVGDKAILWLEPKDKTYMFKMKIYVDTKNWLPIKTTWEDDNQLITSELLNVKMNTGVKDELFKFK